MDDGERACVCERGAGLVVVGHSKSEKKRRQIGR